jgi:hypothetical protein
MYLSRIFVVDALNFSFWHDDPAVPFTGLQWRLTKTTKNLMPIAVSFEGNSYTGYWSLCAAVNRAIAVRLLPVRWHIIDATRRGSQLPRHHTSDPYQRQTSKPSSDRLHQRCLCDLACILTDVPRKFQCWLSAWRFCMRSALFLRR